MNTLTRRSFLKLSGCAAVALAVPSMPASPAPTATARRKRLFTHLQCVSSTGRRVGVLYEVPDEWFRAAAKGTIMSGSLEICDWDGPPCFITHMALLGPLGEVARLPITVSSAVTPGDTLAFPALRISVTQG